MDNMGHGKKQRRSYKDRHDRNRDEGRRRHLQAPRDGEERTHPAMRFRLLPLSHLTPGTVLRASVDYTDGTGRKVRPVVVVSANSHEIEVHPVTSQMRQATTGRATYIEDWDKVGLTRPSAIQSATRVIPRSDAIEKLGHLGLAALREETVEKKSVGRSAPQVPRATATRPGTPSKGVQATPENACKPQIGLRSTTP